MPDSPFKWVWRLALLLSFFGSRFAAAAHPLVEGRWRVDIDGERLVGKISVSLAEVSLGLGRGGALSGATNIEAISSAAETYCQRLSAALEVRAAGRLLSPAAEDFALVTDASDGARALYTFSYPLAPAVANGPWQFRHDSGSPTGTSPEAVWGAAYWLEIFDGSGHRLGARLMPRGVLWNLPNDAVASSPAWMSFFQLGVSHILTGWDHLLFLAAITLGARKFVDFFRLALAFTAAHSISVSLTAAGWAHPADRWVDPLIAGSILFVAVENAAAPGRPVSLRRIAVVFGFGLIHGLGFASGLTDALSGIRSLNIAGAVALFCAGVEAGHLAAGMPFFLVLTMGRRRWPESFSVWAVRRGSWLVAAGGAWFLAAALFAR